MPGKRRAASHWPHIRKWRWPHIRKWRWSHIRKWRWPHIRKWPWSHIRKSAAVAVALGVYAAGIYFLWGAVREPLFFKWVAVDVLLGAYAAGIYFLWGAVRKPLFFKWAQVVAALGVCAVGILLLWGVWDGTPVAGAFTRVGGPTRVETALEASRFWLTPPQYVVKTQTDSSQLMLGAARCAIVHDAPLLFTSRDPKRKRRVNTMINDWRKIRNQEGVARLEVIHIESQPEVTGCVGKKHRGDIARLSTLEVSNPLIRLRHVRVLQTLDPVVVFAAAIEPGHLPDIAIGLALAAHMARANRETVSLVVVPHYLESDPELEKKLQSQHELVTGGVVLGQTPTVPEDTRALLRQLLTSRDRQGLLAQVQDNLGSVGSLIAALLALVGLAAATAISAPIIIGRLERNEQIKSERDNEENLPAEGKKLVPIWKKTEEEPEPSNEKASDWITALGDTREVTVWLRSGQQVTGTIEDQIPKNTRDATVFRIKNRHGSRAPGTHEAPSVPNDVESLQDVSGSEPEGEYAYVLVSVKEIEQIHFNDSKSTAANANQKQG